MGGKVVHFDVIGPDGEALQRFYAELFRWRLRSVGGGSYALVHDGDDALERAVELGAAKEYGPNDVAARSAPPPSATLPATSSGSTRARRERSAVSRAPGRRLPVIALAAAVAAVLAADSGRAIPLRGPDAGATTVKPEPPRPHTTWKPIPFGEERRRATSRYAKRHSGEWAWRLETPRVIVQHYTASTSWEPAWNTFAANSPHLGELPGTCAHFIVDTDGTVYHLVRLDTRCRHTIGLNHVSIGIEHVGTSDRSVMRNDAQMRSSLRLTLWLMDRFAIRLRNVIGHDESLASPFHRELYDDWRCRTHKDFAKETMDRYRARTTRLADRFAVALGRPGEPVSSNC